jgi:hypothetical protein
MRPGFSDGNRLKEVARSNWESGMTGIKRWWVNKYKLPPNHPLFLERSLSEWTLEMYEDLFAQRSEVESELEEGDGETEELLQRLNAINRALGDEELPQDDLFDQWERDVEAGRIPDLDASPGG